jgi:hypothetical protein
VFSIPGFLFSLIFGGIGFGVFVYGKRQARMFLVVVGLALMVYPYFVSNSALSLAIGTLPTVAAAAIARLRIDPYAPLPQAVLRHSPPGS